MKIKSAHTRAVLAAAGLAFASSPSAIAYGQDRPTARTQGPVRFPDTRAGNLAQAYVDFYNSSEPDAERRLRQYSPDIERQIRERAEIGGLELVQLGPPVQGSVFWAADPENQMSFFARERISGEIHHYYLSTLAAPQPIRLRGFTRGPAVHIPGFPAPARIDDAALGAFADRFMAQLDFAGVAVVAREGRTVFVKTRGAANRETGQPFLADTRLRIGAIGKVFTAVALLQLAEEGRFDLDAPMAQFKATFPDAESSGAVTVRRLLNNLPVLGPSGEPLSADSNMELALDAQVPGILTRIIESASGQSYADYLRTRIFAPSGMNRSGVSNGADVPGLAVTYCATYGRQGEGAATVRYQPVGVFGAQGCPRQPLGGATGIYTTAGDLAAFASALAGGRLLNAEHTRQVMTGQSIGDGCGREVYGLTHCEVDGIPRVVRSGLMQEPDVQLRIVAGGKAVVVVLSNIDRPTRAGELAFALADRVQLE